MYLLVSKSGLRDLLFKEISNSLEHLGVSRNDAAIMLGMSRRNLFHKLHEMSENVRESEGLLLCWKVFFYMSGRSGSTTWGQLCDHFKAYDELTRDQLRAAIRTLLRQNRIWQSGHADRITYKVVAENVPNISNTELVSRIQDHLQAVKDIVIKAHDDFANGHNNGAFIRTYRFNEGNKLR
jgi:hypothetical protein